MKRGLSIVWWALRREPIMCTWQRFAGRALISCLSQPSMNLKTSSRREFLRTSAVAVGSASFVPYVSTANAEEAALPKSKNDRPDFAVIGLRYQGSVLARYAQA